MSRPKILLKPDDFWALYLSAYAFGGVGRGASYRDGVPHCVRGHTLDLDLWEPWSSSVAIGPSTEMAERLADAGLDLKINDPTLEGAGLPYEDKMDIDAYIDLLNIDIKESA